MFPLKIKSYFDWVLTNHDEHGICVISQIFFIAGNVIRSTNSMIVVISFSHAVDWYVYIFSVALLLACHIFVVRSPANLIHVYFTYIHVFSNFSFASKRSLVATNKHSRLPYQKSQKVLLVLCAIRCVFEVRMGIEHLHQRYATTQMRTT